MNSGEIDRWREYLHLHGQELLERLEKDQTDNFFDANYEELQGYNEELHIVEWNYHPSPGVTLHLIDIFGYPGDNEDGGIWILPDVDPALLNSDQNLSVNMNNIDPWLTRDVAEFQETRIREDAQEEEEDG